MNAGCESCSRTVGFFEFEAHSIAHQKSDDLGGGAGLWSAEPRLDKESALEQTCGVVGGVCRLDCHAPPRLKKNDRSERRRACRLRRREIRPQSFCSPKQRPVESRTSHVEDQLILLASVSSLIGSQLVFHFILNLRRGHTKPRNLGLFPGILAFTAFRPGVGSVR